MWSGRGRSLPRFLSVLHANPLLPLHLSLPSHSCFFFLLFCGVTPGGTNLTPPQPLCEKVWGSRFDGYLFFCWLLPGPGRPSSSVSSDQDALWWQLVKETKSQTLAGGAHGPPGIPSCPQRGWWHTGSLDVADGDDDDDACRESDPVNNSWEHVHAPASSSDFLDPRGRKKKGEIEIS